MKIYSKTILCFSALITFAAPALAADAPASALLGGFFFKPYVGADYQYTSVNYKDVPGASISYGDLFASSFNGGDIHIGARIHKYLGFEGGYFDTASSSKSNLLGTTASSSVKFDGWTFDALGYLPLGESQKFELIGTAGIARISGNASVTVSGTTYSGSGSSTKGRIGAGAQYWLTDNLNVRGIIRYQDGNGAINDAIVTSLGLNFQF